MKISDQNMPNWQAKRPIQPLRQSSRCQEIQALAESLGIHVEQAKCDVGKQESVEAFIESATPNLTGALRPPASRGEAEP